MKNNLESRRTQFFLKETKKLRRRKIKPFLVQNTPSSFYTMQWGIQKKVCKFCNEDIVMKSLVVGMNQTREKLMSLNLHLTKKHQVARKKRVMLLVGNISLKEREFLELSLKLNFVHIRGSPFTDVCCAFCGNKFHLE